MHADPIEINPELDLNSLAARYAAERFVQIANFFTPGTADRIDRALRQTLPWRLIYVDPGQGVVQLSEADLKRIGQAGLQQIMRGILHNARRNVGYFYKGYHLTRADSQAAIDVPELKAVAEFLNGPEFLAFGARIIAESGLTQTDAQATLFQPGHFLTRHIDDGANQERRAAYTLSFTRQWQTDWGGQLQFIDPQTTDVTRAWIPRWNLLTLFDGRQVHAVSPISQFAGEGRYSIVGWLRND